MTIWAKGKHYKLKKEFDGNNGSEKYPSERKAIIPFIL